jgi:chitinase
MSMRNARTFAVGGVVGLALMAAGVAPAAAGDNDTQAPTTPGNVQVIGTTFTSVTASWEPSTDNVQLVGYWIAIDSGPAVYAASLSDTTATVHEITPGQRHTLRISARDNAGNFSREATVDFTTPADREAPSAPTNLSGVVDLYGGRFVWNRATDNSGEVRYELYQDDSTVPFFTGTFTSSQSEAIFGPQLVEGTHVITVRARDRAGNLSAPSNGVRVTV